MKDINKLREYQKEWYQKQKENNLLHLKERQQKNNKQKDERARQKKVKYILLKGGVCTSCGYKYDGTNAKKRQILIDRGIKESKCKCCGLSEWMGKPIPLELHHKDFNHYNNSLDNLQILCANCHMQAHDYCNYKKNKK